KPSIASCAALRIETPIGLAPPPFWVSGRIIPTRTWPEPIVWPTSGPAAGGTAGPGLPTSLGRSTPTELQPASVNANPPPSAARLVKPRLASGLSAAIVISTSCLEVQAGAPKRRRTVAMIAPPRRIRRLSAEIVAFSPALGYAVDRSRQARRAADAGDNDRGESSPHRQRQAQPPAPKLRDRRGRPAGGGARSGTLCRRDADRQPHGRDAQGPGDPRRGRRDSGRGHPRFARAARALWHREASLSLPRAQRRRGSPAGAQAHRRRRGAGAHLRRGDAAHFRSWL